LDVLAVLSILAAPVRADFAEDAQTNWHRWRGPDATGVAPHGNPPLHWDAETNVKWKILVEGRGTASPIVWGDRLFLLTAVDTGQPGPNAAKGAKHLHQFKVLCFNRTTGERLWEKIACEAVPHERLHETNTHASGSPTTDGRLLYASFGSYGIYCYDLDGHLKWQRDGRHAPAMSSAKASRRPFGDTLIVNWDQESDSFIRASTRTGDDKWSGRAGSRRGTRRSCRRRPRISRRQRHSRREATTLVRAT
jgi:outer membrane protein assembly factor BamB